MHINSEFRIPISELPMNVPEKLEPNEATANDAEAQSNEPQLERGTYEIIRNRLQTYSGELRERINKLNEERREVFGSIPTELISTQRITTSNNCVAQDLIPVGEKFIFSYNVLMGLKAVTEIADVFGVFEFLSLIHI